MKEENISIAKTIENYKSAIKNRDLLSVNNCYPEFFDYIKTLENEDAKEINALLNPIIKELSDEKKSLTNFTDKEIDEVLEKVIELEVLTKTITPKAKEETHEPKEEKPVPESLNEIKQEIDEILGVSLLNEIENVDLKDEKYEILTEERKEQFNKLKAELKGFMYSLTTNKKEIERIRLEMYLILGPELYSPYETHKDNIALLDKEAKERFEKLKEEFDKKIKNKIEEKKETSNDKTEPEYTEKEENFINKETSLDKKIQAIREEMAVLIYGKDMEHKAYEGIENIDENSPTSNLENEEEKDRFRELRAELLPLLEKKSKRSTRKGKAVKTVKSAKSFYQKHKKAILLVAGLALFAVTIGSLLPSIMYLNSALWNVAVSAGASAEVGLPVVLHDINAIIGSKIGASYAAGSGVWTLANGAALNATAAEAGILATLGRVALIGAPLAGAGLAIKNAIRLAKEKIKKRKEKIETEEPERKGHFFRNVKDYVKNKYNTIKDGVKNKYNSFKDNRESKKEEKIQKKETRFKNKTTTSMLVEAYELGLIDDEQFEKYLEADANETLEFIKNGFKEEKGKGSK